MALRELTPMSVTNRLWLFAFSVMVMGLLLWLVDRVIPVVTFDFGDRSWIVLQSLRVLGLQLTLLAAWRRIVRPQHSKLVTLGLVLYAAGVIPALTFDWGVATPLYLHALLFHSGVIAIATGLIAVKTEA
jgi:hypothetical protein